MMLMRWLWHTWRVMYHSIHDWNWSWNHWTSRQPALGPWRQLGGQGIGCSQLPAVAAAVRGEPEFKFSSGRSCTVCTVCTLVQSPDQTGSVRDCTVCGGRDWGREWSVWIQRAWRAHSECDSQCYYSVITEWERESCPGQCTPTCTRT